MQPTKKNQQKKKWITVYILKHFNQTSLLKVNLKWFFFGDNQVFFLFPPLDRWQTEETEEQETLLSNKLFFSFFFANILEDYNIILYLMVFLRNFYSYICKHIRFGPHTSWPIREIFYCTDFAETYLFIIFF